MSKLKKKFPLVCIVIPHYNGEKMISQCLRSLRKTNYPNYKVTVLANGSQDNSRDVVKKDFKEVELISVKKNIGFSGGSNFLYSYAIKKYNPKYLVNMSNDVVTIQPSWLSFMVKELEVEESRGICGNKLIFPDGRLQLLYYGRDYKKFTEKDKGDYDFVKEVDAVGGANILIKRSVIEKIKGTDEKYAYGPDDIDFCFRAKKAGFKIVYCGLSKSIHIGSFYYKSASKDEVYKNQSFGQMVFYFRWGSKYGKVKIILLQLLRAFLTPKDPFKKDKNKGLYFHSAFPRRLFYWTNSLFDAIKYYSKEDFTHSKI